MELKSLALKTDLIFTKQDGEILDRGNYLVVKTNSNPNFFWGNLLIFENAPTSGVLDEWVRIFDKEFTDSRIYHKTFAWDSEEIGDIKPFEEAGYKFEKSLVLTTTKVQIIAPKRPNLKISVIPIKKYDWGEVVRVQSSTNPQYANFYAKQALAYQKMVEAGLGEWFGAYLDNLLVGSLGIFKEGTVGRYQIVSTDPAFQRQGICGTLVYKTAQYAFSKMGIEKLVMVADEDYHAARIYESVGFRPVEKMYGVCWSKEA
jgi:RimJ/RimL family protein N-acetyltransferase